MGLYKWIRIILMVAIAYTLSFAIGCGKGDKRQEIVRQRQKHGDRQNKGTGGEIQTKPASNENKTLEDLISADKKIRRDIEQQRNRIFPEIREGKVPFDPGVYQLYSVTAFTRDGDGRKTVESYDQEYTAELDNGHIALLDEQEGKVTKSYRLEKNLIFPVLIPTLIEIEVNGQENIVRQKSENNSDEDFLTVAVQVTTDSKAKLTTSLPAESTKDSRDILHIINEGPKEDAHITPLNPMQEESRQLIRFSYEEKLENSWRSVVLTYEKLESPVDENGLNTEDEAPRPETRDVEEEPESPEEPEIITEQVET